jgi:hypothetical protein
MNRFGRRGVRRETVADDLDGLTFGYLKKAGGLAGRGAVHVKHFEGRGLSLGGEFGGVVGQVAEIVHLLVGEQEIGIGPAFDPLHCADFNKTAAEFQDIEFIAMFDGGDGGGFRGEVFSQIEGDGADVGDSGRWLLGRMRGTGGEKDEEGDG